MVCEEVWDEGGWSPGDPSPTRTAIPKYPCSLHSLPTSFHPALPPLSLLKYEITSKHRKTTVLANDPKITQVRVQMMLGTGIRIIPKVRMQMTPNREGEDSLEETTDSARVDAMTSLFHTFPISMYIHLYKVARSFLISWWKSLRASGCSTAKRGDFDLGRLWHRRSHGCGTHTHVSFGRQRCLCPLSRGR